MPVEVHNASELARGDIYEDCAYHPCLCVSVGEPDDPDGVLGISLVDGSYPHSCSVEHCGVRRLTVDEALQWRSHGPSDVVLEPEYRWWDKPRGPEQVFAVIRIDQDVESPQDMVTVKEIVRGQDLAVAEAERLNKLNEDKRCFYFIQATRLFGYGFSAGSTIDRSPAA